MNSEKTVVHEVIDCELMGLNLCSSNAKVDIKIKTQENDLFVLRILASDAIHIGRQTEADINHRVKCSRTST